MDAPPWQQAPQPSPASWQQPTPAVPAPWETSPQHTRGTTKARGAAGGVLAALGAAVKYGAVALKFGKFGPMVISMALSVGALSLLYGWTFGAGLVALILVHEMGHVLFAKAEGVKTTLPLFLGPLGALIFLRSEVRDARQEAVIAIGGPLVGTAGAIACALLAAEATGSTRLLLIALAYAGFFINLFNLVPIVPLDGGRVTRSVPLWLLFSGLAVIGGFVWASARWGQGVNPIVVIVLIIAGIAAFQRLFRRRQETDFVAAVPANVRLAVGAGWIALIGVTGIGMSVAHNALVNGGAISAPNNDSVGPVRFASAIAGDAGSVDNDLNGVVAACASRQVADCRSAVDGAVSDLATLQSDVASAHGLSPGGAAAQARLSDELGALASRFAAMQAAANNGDAGGAANIGFNAQMREWAAAGPDLNRVNAG